MQVSVAGRDVVISAGKQRVVMATLLLRANRTVSVDELVERVWGEDHPADARAVLQTYVQRLRRTLGPGVIHTHPPGYLIEVQADHLDVTRAEELLRQARQAKDPATEAQHLNQALTLWRGPALVDVPSDSLQRDEGLALAERRRQALHRRIELDLAAGLSAQAVAELQTLTAEHPLDERFWALRMRALTVSGRKAEALEVFRGVRQQLVDQLGVEPGAELRELHQAILRDEPLGTAMACAVEIANAVPAQLPPDILAFTGRTEQLCRLDDLVARAHPHEPVLATIEGPAGVGKTALAVHWSQANRSRFPDGQLYADLRGYSHHAALEPAELLARFLRGLGVAPQRLPADVDEAAAMYRSLLSGRKMLVLLDNASDAGQVRPLLPGGAGCLVLVTSRDLLGDLVAGEGAHRLVLPVMSEPESMRVLARVVGEARVQPQQQAARQLCCLCGGLPLALRLAAADLSDHPHRNIAEYTAQLAKENRLTGPTWDKTVDRPGAVRAAFDLSYGRLPQAAQRAFRLLSIWPGEDLAVSGAAALLGCPPEAARNLLDRLVRGSLLQERTAGRYSFHDLIRRYAENLCETQVSHRQRQSCLKKLYIWYLSGADAAAMVLYPQVARLPLPTKQLAGAAVPQFNAPPEALAWLDSEYSNISTAVAHAASHGPRPMAWLLADCLRGYLWQSRRFTGWAELAKSALAAAHTSGPAQARASAWLSLGDLALLTGHYPQSVEHYSAALAAARDAGWASGSAAALGSLGVGYRSMGRPAEAADHHEQALAVHRRTGRRGGEGVSLGNLGVAYEDLGRLDDAAEHTAQALAVFRELGSRPAEANALGNLGRIERLRSRYAPAAENLSTALALQRQVGQRSGEATALTDLAALHHDQGDRANALELAITAARLAGQIEDLFWLAASHNALGRARLSLGETQLAVQSHETALQHASRADDPGGRADALIGLAWAHRHATLLADAAANASTALDVTRRSGHRILEGRARLALACIVAEAGGAGAVAHAQAALHLHRATGYRLGQAQALAVLACLADPDDSVHYRRQAQTAYAVIGVQQAIPYTTGHTGQLTELW